MVEILICMSCLNISVMIRKPLIRLGSNMPAIAEHVTRSESELFLVAGGGLPPLFRSGKLHDVFLYFGIIDILQDYDITKKLEHAYKSLQADPNSISAVDPKLYSRRFQDFISRIFVEDDWHRASFTKLMNCLIGWRAIGLPCTSAHSNYQDVTCSCNLKNTKLQCTTRGKHFLIIDVIEATLRLPLQGGGCLDEGEFSSSALEKNM